jgi:hypothetical protein
MTKPALVVYGTDSLSKPHASWFPAEEQETVIKAAGVMGFSTLVVATDEQVELARKLPRGRIFDGGKAFVPFVKHALYEKITTLAANQPKPDQTTAEGQDQVGNAAGAQASSPASQEPTAAADGASPVLTNTDPVPATGAAASSPPHMQSSPHRRPKHWDEITAGDLVLAYDADSEAWYEAIVLQIDGELLRLRWRDYPLERIAPQRRDQLALLPPSA